MADYQIKKISVVGDSIQYKLSYKDNHNQFPGGAYATTHILKSAFSSSVSSVKISGYFAGIKPSKTILRRIDVFTKSSEKYDEKVWRCIVEPSKPLENDTENKNINLTKKHEECGQILVIEDLGEFINNHESNNFNLNQLTDLKENICYPQIVLAININSPDINKIENEDGHWKELYQHKEKVLVIVDADHLCLDGMNISRGISWELTAQDYLAELFTHPILQKIGEFQHLVVRFGVGGVIYSFRIDERRHHRLFFDPESYQMGLDGSDDGFMFGNNSILVASIIKEIVEHINTKKTDCHDKYSIINQAIGKGISKGIYLCQKNHEHGFGDVSHKKYDIQKNLNECVRSFSGDRGDFCNCDYFKDLFEIEPSNIWKRIANERIPVGNRAWSILNQSAEYNLLTIAEYIVREGVNALNNKSLQKTENIIHWSPLIIFEYKDEKSKDKSLAIVDRREVEGYSIAHRLINQTKRLKEAQRPLSIALFGPPGAGKSTVAKAIAMRKNDPEADWKVFNLAEYTDPKKFQNDCKNYFTQLKTNAKSKRIPVIMFDEFDCKLGEHDLGWLKYFLPLMEDFSWENYQAKSNNNTPKVTPIFLFAGGTSHTYSDFTREDPSLGEEEQLKFAMAKGRDFVSRLRGHINILGPNRVDEYDDAYVVRRALVLHFLLRSCFDKGKGKIPEERVSQEFIRAMLQVSSYKHGTRSMRAIIDMCVQFGGDSKGRYVSASLPTTPQLNMHVDGKELMELLLETRK